jgi:hypothetical protein
VERPCEVEGGGPPTRASLQSITRDPPVPRGRERARAKVGVDERARSRGGRQRERVRGRSRSVGSRMRKTRCRKPAHSRPKCSCQTHRSKQGAPSAREVSTGKRCSADKNCRCPCRCGRRVLSLPASQRACDSRRRGRRCARLARSEGRRPEASSRARAAGLSPLEPLLDFATAMDPDAPFVVEIEDECVPTRLDETNLIELNVGKQALRRAAGI